MAEGRRIKVYDAPKAILDWYADVAEGSGDALVATVKRTRSLAGRDILAYLASRRRWSYRELVAEAHSLDLAGIRHSFELARRFDSKWLAHLAEVVAVQSLIESDLSDAIRLYEVLEAIVGRIYVDPAGAKVFADCLLNAGRTLDVVERLWDLPISARDRSQIHSDLANPFLDNGLEAAPVEVWLRLFELALGYDPPEGQIALLDQGVSPFDRLTSTRAPILKGPLVSVILTTFKPDEGLVTATRSLIEQSWESLEILVVDDGSPSDHHYWLEQVEAMDQRVRVVRLDVNGGTYRARNVGLAVATGDFATFQDSDDWSHPRRIERQVEPLLDDRSLVATTSRCVRATENLGLASTGYHLFRLNTSSLMFRLNTVLGRIGFMDDVRKAADSEYLFRIMAAFDGGYLGLKQPALAVVRLASGSLSRSEFRPGWHHPARGEYRVAYETWHQRISDGASPFVDMYPKRRTFPAPERIRTHRKHNHQFDLVLVADWRSSLEPPVELLEMVKGLRGAGRVGIAHMESYAALTSGLKGPYRDMHLLARIHNVSIVHFDDALEVERVLVARPDVFQFPSFGQASWVTQRVQVLSRQPLSNAHIMPRWDPENCRQNMTAFFGVAPVWLPEDEIRSVLTEMAAVESPSIEGSPGKSSVDEPLPRPGP